MAFGEPVTLDTSIADLDLTARARHCLWNADLRTVGAVVQWHTWDLLKLKNFGVGSLRDVTEVLAAAGFALKGARPAYLDPVGRRRCPTCGRSWEATP